MPKTTENKISTLNANISIFTEKSNFQQNKSSQSNMDGWIQNRVNLCKFGESDYKIFLKHNFK